MIKNEDYYELGGEPSLYITWVITKSKAEQQELTENLYITWVITKFHALSLANFLNLYITLVIKKKNWIKIGVLNLIYHMGDYKTLTSIFI